MKRYLIVIFALMLVLPNYAQKKLTLQEAITIALQRNSSLIKLKYGLDASQSSLKNAWGQLIPSLSTSAAMSWQRIDDKGGGQQRDYLGNLSIVPATTTENRSYQISASGNVVLFNGLANIATISQKQDNVKSDEYSIAKQKQNIVFQTTDYYYTVLNADSLRNVREENVKYFKRFLETVQERNKLGAVTLADVYSAQTQLGNAELSLIQAQNTFESSKAALLNYLALNVLEDYSLVDPFTNTKVVDTDAYMKDFEDMRSMVSAALDKRFDYKSQQLTVTAAEKGITIAKGGIYPSLGASYQYSTSAVVTDELFNRKSFYIGAQITLPIFSNFNTDYAIQYAEVGMKSAQEDLTALERQIKIEIKQTYLDLVAAKKSLDVAVKNADYAKETQRINQERYNLGSATMLDILQANRDYIDALRNKINAVYDFYRQHDKLNNAIGRLDFSKYE
jgi:outer membrane protein